MFGIGRAVAPFRSRISPLAAAVVVLVLLTTLLAGAVMAAGNVITSPDEAGDVGWYTSLALDGSGSPVVTYYHNSNSDLKVIHCGDANCSSGNVITSPDTIGDVGSHTSQALDVSGNPVVSYYDSTNGDLKVLHCGDATCSTGNVITSPDTVGDVGSETSLALDVSGSPVVSYYDVTNGDLKVLHCGDPTCSSGNVITSPDTVGNVGLKTSLVLDGSGNPVVSYWALTSVDLKLLHCGDATCSSGNVITSPDTAGIVGEFSSLALDSTGNPVISYWDATNEDLKVVHCGDANCSTGNVITSPDTTGNVGWYTSLALDASGNPVVSYRDLTNQDLKVLHCGDPNCTSGNVITSPDTAGFVGTFMSLVLDGDGNPVVAYLNVSTRDLKILHCGDPNCAPSAGESVLWGDGNCSGSANPVDSLLTLRFDAGLSTNTGTCPDFGQVVDVAFASPHPWGDVDCGGEVTPVDSLKILRYDAGLEVTQPVSCPLLGSEVTIVVS